MEGFWRRWHGFPQDNPSSAFFDLHSQRRVTMLSVCSAARGCFFHHGLPALLGRFLPNLGPCNNTAPFFGAAAPRAFWPCSLPTRAFRKPSAPSHSAAGALAILTPPQGAYPIHSA